MVEASAYQNMESWLDAVVGGIRKSIVKIMDDPALDQMWCRDDFVESSLAFSADGGLTPQDYAYGINAGLSTMREIRDGWKRQGRPRLCLTASTASLMASTKAPVISCDEIPVPYDVFVIEVPGEWTSVKGVGPLQVMFARSQWESGGGFTVIMASRERVDQMPRVPLRPTQEQIASLIGSTFVRVLRDGTPLSEGDLGEMPEHMAPAIAEATRYLVNTCLMVSAHNECSRRRGGKNARNGQIIEDIHPPKNVTVTAEFRNWARDLISDRRISERKQALLHIVRGHWKRQVRGPGRSERSMIWIHPYQRGAESLGRVVERMVAV